MEDKRKQVIINEILFWKENRILPEQYCNYLLALYTEGNQPEKARKEKQNKSFYKMNYLFLLIIPIFVVVFYFTELSFILQIALTVFFILIGTATVYYYFKKGTLLQIPLVVTALGILLVSVEYSSNTFPEQTEFLYFTVVINCLLWLFVGWRLKLLYFKVSGVLGIGFLIVSIFLK